MYDDSAIRRQRNTGQHAARIRIRIQHQQLQRLVRAGFDHVAVEAALGRHAEAPRRPAGAEMTGLGQTAHHAACVHDHQQGLARQGGIIGQRALEGRYRAIPGDKARERCEAPCYERVG